MKKKFIIKKDIDISNILKLKKSIGNPFFVLYYSKNKNQTHFKFALSIGKKYGKAYERNLIKRRLRMIIHEFHILIDFKISFVLVIKPKAKNLTFQQIKEDFFILLKKSNLII
ncbi:Ribonuclease P [Candidatus Phytoplasma mali]|uniref:Ribonuclease P protein component n=1 Tax=Phytoplasma mali (strain AT) TaxID=482235 RepID=B3QZF9_PHYMT|nr:ribonuclease P protein component [Candidatus Phytoplasma mali]CAP18566.1 Ribonuclease P [Candidatus Phytoplasma mali]